MNVEQIAKICHEVNRAYCAATGDDSQQPWEDAPEWQRKSVVMGVEFHLSGERQPSDSHVSWMNQKIADGWIWGPVKDEVKKEHPCMVPYHELPVEQQVKDYLFKAVVDSHK